MKITPDNIDYYHSLIFGEVGVKKQKSAKKKLMLSRRAKISRSAVTSLFFADSFYFWTCAKDLAVKEGLRVVYSKIRADNETVTRQWCIDWTMYINRWIDYVWKITYLLLGNYMPKRAVENDSRWNLYLKERRILF